LLAGIYTAMNGFKRNYRNERGSRWSIYSLGLQRLSFRILSALAGSN